MATAEKKEKVQAQTQKAKASGPLMYVGPTLRTVPLIENSVYSAIPDEARAAFDEHPKLRLLFVPIRRYPDVERQMRARTGVFYAAYNAVLGL